MMVGSWAGGQLSRGFSWDRLEDLPQHKSLRCSLNLHSSFFTALLSCYSPSQGAPVSSNTWEALKDDLKYVETSTELFLSCYVIRQMLFPRSLGGHMVVC